MATNRKKHPKGPPYKSAIVTVVTPQGEYTSAEIPFDKEENVSMVQALLESVYTHLQIKLPLGPEEVLLLPTDVIANSVFKIRYIK